METEEEHRIQRMQRIEKMKREKKRTEFLYRAGVIAASVLAILVGVGIGIGAAMFSHGNSFGSSRGKGAEGNQTGDALSGDSLAFGEGKVPGQELSGEKVLGEELFREGEVSGEELFGKGEVPGQELSREGVASEELLAKGESFYAEQPEGRKDSVDSTGTEGEAGQKRKGNRGRREEFDILRASRVIPISGTAVAADLPPKGELSQEGELALEEDALSDVPVEVSGLSGSPDSVRTPIWAAHGTADTVGFGEEVISKYGILVDVWDGSILSEKRARERMNPASMTKVLTVLVAVEHLTQEDMDQTEIITQEITDYCVSNDCSIAGYDRNEEAMVKDLLYGTILPSGADAALALANYVAGSHEAFVDMMNEKVEEMGLSETTHFTNCVGLYDEDHYTTAYDMAVILKVAADNEFCREVLSRKVYTTAPTEQHPEGLLLVNWFLRRIEDRDTHGTVLCAKTGFVDEAGSCAASLSIGDDGREYICVTGASTGTWDCIADQETLYRTFLPVVPSDTE